MIVTKIINNNIVSSIDDGGNELVVMGKGIGFGNKKGEVIDDNKVEKIFRLENKNDVEKLESLLTHVPVEEVKITDDIVQYAQQLIRVKLSTSIYVTLTDHINFAIERMKENMNFKNPLLSDIKKYYPLEFEVGVHALELIQERLKITLPIDEAGFIALHFVNSEYNTHIGDIQNLLEEIHGIMDIIANFYDITFDETSLSYERLLTHVKFLQQRVYRNELLTESDPELEVIIQKKYAEEMACCEKIAAYLKETANVDLPEVEKTYMALHIKRVMQDERKE